MLNDKDQYANSYQDGLDVKTKSPLAVGLGCTLFTGKGKIHLSSEYYNKVASYTIMRANNHTMQSKPDSIISFGLVDQLKSVINFGIGLEWKFSEKVSAYGSFSTDYSAAPSETAGFIQNTNLINSTTIKSNYYHFGGGVVLTFSGADVTLGATHTGARQNFPRPISFPEEGG